MRYCVHSIKVNREQWYPTNTQAIAAFERASKRAGIAPPAWRWQPGKSANPGGLPRHDLAATIARACFENNPDALYKAFSKALLKGNAYAFKELSDRAYGKMKESIQHDISPLRDMSKEDIEKRIAQLEIELGVTPTLPPASEDPKPN